MSSHRSSTTKNLMESSPQTGQFSSGFFLGVMAGFLGMYVFGTKKGQNFLEKLKQELPNIDTSEQPQRSLRDEAPNLIASAQESVDSLKQTIQTAAAKANSSLKKIEANSKSQTSNHNQSIDFPKFKKRHND